MKVAVATPIYPPELGLPASYVKQLAVRLGQTSAVTVVAYASQHESAEGVRLVAVSKRWPLAARTLTFTWRLFVEARGAQAIYAQRAMAAGLPAAVVGWLRRVPVVVNLVADELGDAPPAWRAWLQGLVLRSARAVVVPTAYMARRCQERYGVAAERVATCPPPLPPDQVLPFAAVRSPHQVMLPAAKVAAATAEAAVEALAGARVELGDIELVVMGEPPASTRLRQLVADRKLADCVTFLGRVSCAEEWYRYRQSAACIVSLSDELGEREARKAAAAGAQVVEVRAGQALAPALIEALRGRGRGTDRWSSPSWPDYLRQLSELLQ